MLVRTGFESHWGWISVAVPVAEYLAMLNLWLACQGLWTQHNLPLARHAAMDMSVIGWGIDCIQFKLYHKSVVAGLNCGGWQYNKCNFTYFASTTWSGCGFTIWVKDGRWYHIINCESFKHTRRYHMIKPESFKYTRWYHMVNCESFKRTRRYHMIKPESFKYTRMIEVVMGDTVCNN